MVIVLVMPEGKTVVNQRAELTPLPDFQSGITEEGSYDKDSTSIISKNIIPTYLPDFGRMKENLLANREKFIELDLNKMKANIYQEGKEIKEFPILTKGDSLHWGGTPVGVYSVLSKHKIAFSNISRVYMPYAIQFYGKYFLHGQPYYPGGRLLQSPISGGCIQFLHKYAREIYNFAEIGMPILVIDKKSQNDDYKYSSKPTTPFPEISAKSYLVADLNNGFILTEKNSSQKFPIASITKLMTAIIVAEHIDLRRSILITREMIEPFKSYSWFRPKLKVGERYRIVELFYPSLIKSSNDAAEALSYFLGKKRTIQLMNEKTKAIGMVNTKFVEPTGLDEENISTAQDLFYLGRYILSSRPPLLKISKGEAVRSFGPVRFKNLRNKNILFDHPNFVGGKTGHLAKQAGLFLLEFTTKEDNQLREISIIILDSDNLRNDLAQILEWLKNYFMGHEETERPSAYAPIEKSIIPLKTI